MMEIEFYDPNLLDKNLKATAHKSGKLGFTVDAANKLELSQEKSIGIGHDKSNPADKNLYVVVYNENRPHAFKVNKAGLYYYVNMKPLFDTLKIDYKKESVVFDIAEHGHIDGHKLYRFEKREKKQKMNLVD